jgi:hypothetical protein
MKRFWLTVMLVLSALSLGYWAGLSHANLAAGERAVEEHNRTQAMHNETIRLVVEGMEEQFKRDQAVASKE